MFGNNAKDDKSDQAVNSGNTVNILGEGTSIEGTIKTDSDLRIDGYVKASINSHAKIVVGKSGKIEGDITCINADISGYINGQMHIQEMLFIKSTAVIEGDITANKLVVEAGAQFNGNCSMGAKEVRQSNDTEKKQQQQEANTNTITKEAS